MPRRRNSFTVRAIDLDQLADAVAPAPWLMQPALALTARRPNPSLRHPFAQHLLADREPFDQLLARKRRSKVDVVFPDQLQHEVANAIDNVIVGAPATRLVPESRSAMRLQRLQQPPDLFDTPARVRSSEPVPICRSQAGLARQERHSYFARSRHFNLAATAYVAAM